MTRVLLLQLDGKIPNLALMKLASYHRAQGHEVILRNDMRNPKTVHRSLFDVPDKVYASAIFTKTKPACEAVLREYPDAIIGGSGWDEKIRLEQLGISEATKPDYSDYPGFPHSMGFTQRGCRLACSFCAVRRMEGKVRSVASIRDIWRGEPHPRHLLLLDNDFFGQENWRDIVGEIKEGGFKVCLNQGFNVRLINDEQAAAIASLEYRDNEFKTRRLYTAWDNRKDEELLFRNLAILRDHGVRPDDIMVYMLIGYWDGPRITENDLYRHRKLLKFGARPYPMPFVRNDELIGFQRWIVGHGAFHKNVPWSEWVEAGYRPEGLGKVTTGRAGT